MKSVKKIMTAGLAACTLFAATSCGSVSDTTSDKADKSSANMTYSTVCPMKSMTPL